MESHQLQNQLKRTLLCLGALLLSFAFSYSFFFLLASSSYDAFSLRKIRGTSFFYFPLLREKTLPDDLGEEFFYLGRGSQCYVFENRTQSYVLKFFRMNRFRVFSFPYLPPFMQKIQEEKKRMKERKWVKLMQSNLLAATTLAEETQLVYLHLAPGGAKKEVLLYDKLLRPTLISLDEHLFIVQKKATPLYPYLKMLLETKGPEALLSALQKTKELLLSRFHKQIADHDPVIERNLGFVGECPIFIDTGQFSLSPGISKPYNYIPEGEKIFSNLKIWLRKEDPYYADLYIDVLKF